MNKQDIQKIIDPLGYKYISDLHNGLANIVAKINKNGQDFVLKLYTRDYFKKDREQKFIELAGGIMPVPKIIDSGENFLIMEYKDGTPGADIFSQPNDSALEIGRLMGQATKQLHAKETGSDYVGFLSPGDLIGQEYGLDKSNFKTNSEFLKSLIDEQIVRLKEYEVDIPDFTDLDIDIEDDAAKYLIHHDLDIKNANFGNGSITSFFDFEYAMIGSKLFDLAKVYVLGIYLAYHTLGRAKYLDFEKYIAGFYEAYGQEPNYEELRPFYIYVLLNYTLFWLSNPIVRKDDMDKTLPVHLQNLQRLKDHKEIIVDNY